MTNGWQARTALMIGESGIEKLKRATVMICGLGGVGGYVCEALARVGVGKLILTDCDRIDVTNLNRQILADVDNIGEYKTTAAAKRVRAIAPGINAEERTVFLTRENIPLLFDEKIDAVADAIDNISAKIALASYAEQHEIFMVSSMGTGNKTDPSRFEADDIYNTSVCPLAKVMRNLLKKNGVKKLRVVYSKEQPVQRGDGLIGTLSYVPAAAGLLIAKEITEYLLNRTESGI